MTYWCWHMKRTWHATYNPKFEKMELFRHPGGATEKIKGPACMVKTTTLEMTPIPAI